MKASHTARQPLKGRKLHGFSNGAALPLRNIMMARHRPSPRSPKSTKAGHELSRIGHCGDTARVGPPHAHQPRTLWSPLSRSQLRAVLRAASARGRVGAQARVRPSGSDLSPLTP